MAAREFANMNPGSTDHEREDPELLELLKKQGQIQDQMRLFESGVATDSGWDDLQDNLITSRTEIDRRLIELDKNATTG
jgi:hypothetical protein